jgi:hypothetical protein
MIVVGLIAGVAFAGATLAGEHPAGAADLNLNLFGDTNYLVTRDRQAGMTQTSNAFSSPRLELFSTATQGKVAFLAETMFEVGDDNEFGVDVERVEVGYLFSDAFRLRAGRFHTAVGYYNDAFHHGRYFQATVDRPTMVRFEDEGGLIPAHSVGIHADGRFATGDVGGIRYDVDIANGRGQTAGEVTNLEDRNNDKMFNLRLRFEPRFLDGLILGANVLEGGISALTNAADPASPTVFIREWMLGGHAVYLERNVHAIGEYVWISHKTGGQGAATQAAFLELGYELGRVLPYLRGEFMKFPATVDAFFAGNTLYQQRGSSKAGIVGAKVTASEFIAFKLEVELVSRDAGGSIQNFAAQAAFAF